MKILIFRPLILESQMQVALLSRIHHRNLVPLMGYCEEEYQHILVYEYMHNGTLRDHIHGLMTNPTPFYSSVYLVRKKCVMTYISNVLTEPSKQKNLDWLARLRIAQDAAKG